MNITIDERVFQENELPDDNRLNHGHTRKPSIDGFRGIAIVLMFIGNYIANVRWIPKELKHSPDIGLTIADLVAPMFIFAMALTFGPSLTRKQNQFGKRAAFGKMTVRSLSLIGIGAIITAGTAFGSSTSVSPSWGVLQCLGMASLILLIVASIRLVNSRWWIRLIIGLMLLIIYQFLIDRFFLQEVLRSSQNGLLGTLSWGGMLIIAAVIADQFYVITEFGKRTALLATTGSCAIVVGNVLSRWYPISKNRASISYMAISLGSCLLVFALFHILLDHNVIRLTWLRRFGANPLVLYIAHLFIQGSFQLPDVDSLYQGAPIWLTIVQVGIYFVIMNGLAIYLDKKKMILRL